MSGSGATELVRLEQVTKRFAPARRGDPPITVPHRPTDLHVDRGELVVVEGSSGSGKSTMLGLAGLLWTPIAGRVLFLGCDANGVSAAYRNRLRRQHVGFSFQNYQLFERMPAWESVALPLLVRGEPGGTCRRRALELLGRLGMQGREYHRTEQLSGGEQQRVAMARALASEPDLVVADEPLSNADPVSAALIVSLLESCLAAGSGVLVASHDRRFSALARRRLDLESPGG